VSYGNSDELELWLDDKPFVMIRSAMQPQVGEIINVRKKSYVVTSRNFAVDHSDEPAERHVRLIVNVEPVE
jgi:hypothetical protein